MVDSSVSVLYCVRVCMHVLRTTATQKRESLLEYTTAGSEGKGLACLLLVVVASAAMRGDGHECNIIASFATKVVFVCRRETLRYEETTRPSLSSSLSLSLSLDNTLILFSS